MATLHEAAIALLPRSVVEVFVFIGILWFCYTLLQIGYRLTLHPLAKVPGPFLAQISGFYPTISSARGRRHLDQYECHQRYGPIVRWAPDYVLFDSVGAIQTIYGDSRRNNLRKSDFYNFFDEPSQEASTITTLEKGNQGRKRRILSHAFSPQALQGSDDITVSNVERWCELIGRQTADKAWSEPIDMRQHCDWFTMDTAVSLTFSASFDLIGSEKFRFMPSWITSSFRLLTIVGHSPLLPYWPLMKKLRLNYLLDFDGWSRRPKYMSIVNGFMMGRKDAEDEHDEHLSKDFYHWIRNAKDSETKEPYTLTEVLTECAMLMNGGTGGPSTMLTGCFFYLVHNPDVLDNITREIRTTFSTVDEIRAGSKLSKCAYLQGVLDEAVRLAPAHAGSLPRQVMKGGQMVEGVFLPEGTQVGVAAYAVHHNEEYFPQAFRFWPDRWIVNEKGGNSAEMVAKARSALFSFSAGGNNCIGKPTAYQMLGTALARVLWLYDMKCPPGDQTGCGRPGLGKGRERVGEIQLEDMFSIRAPSVMVQFRRREP